MAAIKVANTLPPITRSSFPRVLLLFVGVTAATTTTAAPASVFVEVDVFVLLPVVIPADPVPSVEHAVPRFMNIFDELLSGYWFPMQVRHETPPEEPY
ncbi:hypothetical protein BDR26DRAFT_867836 [Obelidium mucronatum]|nr:hypothetical protein BDR26DRAFT_867836 [Obelidium mucronatum]